jgi:NAD(P)-dependent dehydrogenase (short-subunit alcohol dehydrogenase family)
VVTSAHEDDVRDLVDRTVARFGRLDVAVNCAGTEGKPGPVTEQTAETYAATFDTNVLGTLLSMKHEMHVMLAQRSGSVVNLSSKYGHTGAAGASIYSASKHAVEGLTKSAALEAAASGVRVNIVAPGPIDTRMLNRFTGTAERKTSLRQRCRSIESENPKRSPRSSCSSRPTRRRSSRTPKQVVHPGDEDVRAQIEPISRSGGQPPHPSPTPAVRISTQSKGLWCKRCRFQR